LGVSTDRPVNHLGALKSRGLRNS